MASSTHAADIAGISIAHMSMLELSPPEVVACAAAAGFKAINLRISQAREGETPFPMTPGSPMLRDTTARLRDTGVTVHDVEVIRIHAGMMPDEHDAFFESAAELGARRVIAISLDDRPERTAANLAMLAERAVPFGLSIDLEFMVFTAVKTMESAVAILEASGASNVGVLVDTLHLHRSGGSPSQLAQVPPRFLRFVQLCDAPLTAPADLVHEARHARLLPGEGELPLRELLSALPAGVQFGIEVPFDGARARLPARRRAELTRQAVLRFFETR